MKHTFMCIPLIITGGFVSNKCSIVRAKLIKSTKTADSVHKAKAKNIWHTPCSVYMQLLLEVLAAFCEFTIAFLEFVTACLIVALQSFFFN